MFVISQWLKRFHPMFRLSTHIRKYGDGVIYHREHRVHRAINFTVFSVLSVSSVV